MTGVFLDPVTRSQGFGLGDTETMTYAVGVTIDKVTLAAGAIARLVARGRRRPSEVRRATSPRYRDVFVEAVATAVSKRWIEIDEEGLMHPGAVDPMPPQRPGPRDPSRRNAWKDQIEGRLEALERAISTSTV